MASYPDLQDPSTDITYALLCSPVGEVFVFLVLSSGVFLLLVCFLVGGEDTVLPACMPVVFLGVMCFLICSLSKDK